MKDDSPHFEKKKEKLHILRGLCPSPLALCKNLQEGVTQGLM